MHYNPGMIQDYAVKHNDSLLKKQFDLLICMKLSVLIDTMSPHLFLSKSKSAGEIIREIISAYISSSEETMFGDWLEGLAIYINEKVYSGWKSGIKGVDLEFDNNGKRCIVSIKSGPNWGNSSQTAKMISDFKSAQKTLRTSNSQMDIICVNGCCYGKDNNPDKGIYYKYCGQRFWEFIGGDENIYTDIIEPLGHKAKEKNEEYLEKYSQMINRFTKEFIELFCDNNGKILWKELVKYNSGKK
ncbi:MAG: hypothetical protein LBD13_02475 [Spirochaetaceae bacterium]|nr:hypothetical protein [Spirochaetaceae bacterium]